MEFKDIFVNIIIIGLFVFAFLALGVTLQIDNQPIENLTDNQIINLTYGNLRSDLQGVEGNVSTQRELLEKENPTLATGSLIFYSIISAGKTFSSFLVGIFNTIIILPSAVLGIDPVIFGVLGSLLIGIILLTLWYLWKY